MAMSRLLALLLMMTATTLIACSESGGSRAAANSPAVPTTPSAPSVAVAASPSPVPTRPSPPPSAAAGAMPTAVSAPLIVWVANTDAGGVFLRNSPDDGDRASSILADNTRLTVTGELTEGDGENWYPVTIEDGSSGYVPQQYTTMTDPEAGPRPLMPSQAR
jgi:hypothetical protein